jgi:hypothetical protein
MFDKRFGEKMPLGREVDAPRELSLCHTNPDGVGPTVTPATPLPGIRFR